METNEKNVQDELLSSAHRIWLAGLGALAAAEQEGAKVFNRLVERGREVETKGKAQADEVKQEVKQKAAEVKEEVKQKAEKTFGDLSEKFDEKLTETLHRLGVPTRDEIRALTQKVEELNAKIEQLKPRVTPAATTAEV